jgi:exo-beta-1,3-glucanase (GH17 family)
MSRDQSRRRAVGGFFVAVLAAFGAPAVAAPVCPDRPAPMGLARLQDVMATGRFVAYQPTGLQVFDGRPTHADEAGIAEDLKMLRPRFDGLITYSALNGAERVPDVAAKLGFRAVIVGVWDIHDVAERANAVDLARRQPIVAGVSLGNEIVFGRRGSFADLAAAMHEFRVHAPHVAVSTTEPFHLLLEPAAVPALRAADVVLANVHPAFEPWFAAAPAANAAEFVVRVTDRLAAAYCGPVLVKETGAPSAPVEKGFTPERQAAIYVELQKRFAPSLTRAFAFFSAFDAPWRAFDAHPVPGPHPEEAHWGLYDAQRRPKPAVAEIAPLAPRR